ncbi:hypothetical protein GCM10009799_33030 [Nocardiopsis rhodophaea]|uniref:Hint domain-containing protein n=1 Tax=Nocardiopsis rhodophaea TaxID=280238 RepID=A0ABN2TAE4_9ACTN
MKDTDYDQLGEDLLELVGDIIGYNDARDCLTKGDLMACLWTVVGFTPWGKGAKLVKVAPKILKLWNRWRKAKKVADAAKKRVNQARKKLEEAKKKAEEAKKKAGDIPIFCNGGRKKKNSFIPSTPVVLGDGSLVAIEDIQIGDEVWSLDPQTGEEGPRPVTAVIEGEGDKTLVEITITDDAGATVSVTATAEHPFWAPELAEWVDAIDLRPGTWLRTSAGTWVQVSAAEARTVSDQQVHNLTVDGLHTYYVGSVLNNVLTHNDDGCYAGDAAGSKKAREDKNIGKNKNVAVVDYELDGVGSGQKIGVSGKKPFAQGNLTRPERRRSKI